MKRSQREATTGLLLVGWLGLAGTVFAGPYVNVMQPCDCPPNHYSAMHVLTPVLWRWAAWCQGPCKYTFARVLRPEIATTTYIKRYHCPFVNPIQFSVQNYPGLNGIPPSSSYQAQSETEQERQTRPTEELPPPGADKAPPPEKLPPPKEEPAKK
ncbi:MAG TPA: hypothetical protein VH592_05195 [Gemmataceae bacterium]